MPLPALTSGSGCLSVALLCVKSRWVSVYSQTVGTQQCAGIEPGEHVNHAEEEEEEEDDEGPQEIMSEGTMTAHFLVFQSGRRGWMWQWVLMLFVATSSDGVETRSESAPGF
ncbi:hypothetical protein Q7C36_020524 [Tachysurus vachellii]|uniref:Uncharacterized protein n=1 Tax=Tachysurus vachellii TaxID=175792 RepID=A0AA88IQJ0_TACVA|nr:hypothetical protein Q7C36_020524 [Tachysurus vachellii]